MVTISNSKNFEDLIEEVHKKGICQQCGGCVSFCSSAEFNVIGMKDSLSPPEYVNKENCLECGICYYLCPQTHVLDDDLNKTYKFTNYSSMPQGFVKDVYVCQATDKDFLENGTDGGVVNSIINYLTDEKIIDGAIVAKTKAPFARDAAIARTKEDLLDSSGVKLDISSQLDEVQKFSTYTRSIPELNHYKFEKLAVVGTPCQIYTIRSMEDLGVTPSENIGVCLGLFCYENFNFDETRVKEFEKDFKLKFDDIEKINIKEDLILKLKDGGTKHIKFDDLNDYMRPACNACYDFTNIYADISFGGLGSPDKYTTVLVRTDKGKAIMSKAIEAGVIKCLELNDKMKNQIKTLITRFSQSKLKRYQDFMQKLGLLTEIVDKITAEI